MLRLSKMADYGILMLVQVAGSEVGGLHTTRDLATGSKLPVTTVSKVVKKLVREGFLVSRRGIRGGYTLARPAQDIGMVDVIAALEGPVALTACAAHHSRVGSCDIERTCPARQPWQRLNALLVGALAHVTLADMIGQALPQPAKTLDAP
jgi:FeS assembly SUF system regulator